MKYHTHTGEEELEPCSDYELALVGELKSIFESYLETNSPRDIDNALYTVTSGSKCQFEIQYYNFHVLIFSSRASKQV